MHSTSLYGLKLSILRGVGAKVLATDHRVRVEFKIALLIFKTLNGLAPQYLSELLVVKPRTRYSLRSDSETLLVIPKVTRKTFGDRAFFHAGPTVWNALPSSLRNCRNIDSFKVQLKTYLFMKAFNL